MIRLAISAAACLLWALWQDRKLARHAGQLDHG